MGKIHLEKCRNVRDICYGDIKEKCLIRSEVLSDLSDDDIRILTKTYGVKTVIDLRTPEEREIPDVMMPGVEYIPISLLEAATQGITHEMTLEEKMAFYKENLPDLADLYKVMVFPNTKPQWQQIFDIFVNNEEGAILWHCAEGKDRCGLVAAMIEYALGLDMKTIMQDYLKTNETAEGRARMMYELVIDYEGDMEKAQRTYDEYVAKEEYLNGAFDYIYETYGSIDNFLKEICGVDEAKREILKKKYLYQMGE